MAEFEFRVFINKILCPFAVLLPDFLRLGGGWGFGGLQKWNGMDGYSGKSKILFCDNTFCVLCQHAS